MFSIEVINTTTDFREDFRVTLFEDGVEIANCGYGGLLFCHNGAPYFLTGASYEPILQAATLYRLSAIPTWEGEGTKQ